jgi:signal transduction histidine kinase
LHRVVLVKKLPKNQMAGSSRSVFKTGGTGDVAFAVVVSISYLAMISTAFEILTPTLLVGLIALGTLYIILGIYGYAYVARSAAPIFLLAYFTVQILLSGLIVAVGKGAGFNALLMLPLAGQAVVLLERRWMLAASIAILLTYVAAISLFAGGLVTLWNNLTTFLAGLVFVVVFTQLVVEEEKARAEVERLADQLEEANLRLRQYAVQAEELATSRERNRLAREIHDGLGHYLTTIFMQIQAAQAVLNNDPRRGMDALDKARTLTQTALNDVRHSVAALRSAPQQDRPLPDLITDLLSDLQGTGLETRLEVIGSPRPLSPQVELTCYRATQEGLNNVRKHAQAQHVLIRLDYAQVDHLALVIEDDGIGSDDLQGGFGLLGLRERVALVGGEVTTTTYPGQGFILAIEVPA